MTDYLIAGDEIFYNNKIGLPKPEVATILKIVPDAECPLMLSTGYPLTQTSFIQRRLRDPTPEMRMVSSFQLIPSDANATSEFQQRFKTFCVEATQDHPRFASAVADPKPHKKLGKIERYGKRILNLESFIKPTKPKNDRIRNYAPFLQKSN